MVINIVSIFYFFIILCAFLMVLSNNPIYSVFFLILILINTSILFILFNIVFLGLLLLLVYVGAIAILFLFIVMMLNIKNIEYQQNTYYWIGFGIFFIFGIQFIYFLLNTLIMYYPEYLLFNINMYSFNLTDLTIDELNNIYILKKIGMFLFLKYYIFIFFSGVLLLLALVGCIYLTNYKKGFSTRAQYNQLLRNTKLMNAHLL